MQIYYHERFNNIKPKSKLQNQVCVSNPVRKYVDSHCVPCRYVYRYTTRKCNELKFENQILNGAQGLLLSVPYENGGSHGRVSHTVLGAHLRQMDFHLIPCAQLVRIPTATIGTRSEFDIKPVQPFQCQQRIVVRISKI